MITFNVIVYYINTAVGIVYNIRLSCTLLYRGMIIIVASKTLYTFVVALPICHLQ